MGSEEATERAEDVSNVEDIGGGLCHARFGARFVVYEDGTTPDDTACGIRFTGPSQTLTTSTAPELVNCPFCAQALAVLDSTGQGVRL